MHIKASNDRSKRLSATVAKTNMELWDIDSGNAKNTDSSYGLSGFSRESDSSDQNI